MKDLIFYHRSDLDGKCSAAIAVDALKHQKQSRGYELHGIDYGDPFPWDKIEQDRVVYMLDFSLQPFSLMLELGEKCKLIWIDHHKSAIEESNKAMPKGEQLLEDGRAACELTWQFFVGEPTPRAVSLLGRYDVWDESEKVFPWSEILGFQYGMRMQDTEPESKTWPVLFHYEGETLHILDQGKLIVRYEEQQNKIAIGALGFEIEWEGLRAIVANRGLSNSRLFDSVWDEKKHDVMISFYWSKRGHWKVSLYSKKPDVDCSAICKRHGGGGHAGAAGFQCDELPFKLKQVSAKE